MKYSELISQFKNETTANKKQIEKLLSLNPQQLTWQPAANKWSVMQCLEHMNRTTRHYLQHINPANAKRDDGDNEFKASFMGGFLAKGFAQIPPKRKFKTTKKFNPPNDMNPQEVLKDFISLNEKLSQRLESLGGYNLNKNKIPTPAISFLKFRFGDVINMDAKHTARHLYQIENIMKAEGFPK
jgi:hypothetical protein